MTPEVLARAFEPLFTTMTGRGGTGLGLALVKRMVTEAGGNVSIESTPGTGTTVTIDLRAAPEVAVESKAVSDGPGAVVSIVDPRSAALVRRVLARLGTPVRSERDANARLCVVDPAAVDVKKAEHWLAERPQQRKLILFGRPPAGSASAWEALHPLTIGDPDDFEGLRATIASAVSAS